MAQLAIPQNVILLHGELKRSFQGLTVFIVDIKQCPFQKKIDNEDTTDLEKTELSLLIAESKKIENNTFINILPNFKSELSHQLSSIGAHMPSCENNGFVNEKIHESKVQADHFLAYRYLKNPCDYIHSADTDFVAIIGPQCLFMKNVYFTKDNKSKQCKLSYTLIGGGEEQYSQVSYPRCRSGVRDIRICIKMILSGRLYGPCRSVSVLCYYYGWFCGGCCVFLASYYYYCCNYCCRVWILEEGGVPYLYVSSIVAALMDGANGTDSIVVGIN